MSIRRGREGASPADTILAVERVGRRVGIAVVSQVAESGVLPSVICPILPPPPENFFLTREMRHKLNCSKSCSGTRAGQHLLARPRTLPTTPPLRSGVLFSLPRSQSADWCFEPESVQPSCSLTEVPAENAVGPARRGRLARARAAGTPKFLLLVIGVSATAPTCSATREETPRESIEPR